MLITDIPREEFDRDLPTLPALTIYPEWVWAIGLPLDDAKRVENRTWRPPAALRKRWFAVHAGAEIGGSANLGAALPALQGVRMMARRAGLQAEVMEQPRAGGRRGYEVRIDVVGRRTTPEGSVLTRCYGTTPGWRPDIRELPGEGGPIQRSVIPGLAKLVHVGEPYPEHQGHLRGVVGWRVLTQYGWVFEYARLLAPIPAKGAQGLWPVDDAVRYQLAEQQQGRIPKAVEAGTFEADNG